MSSKASKLTSVDETAYISGPWGRGFKSLAPDQFRVQNRRFWPSSAVAGAQPGHRFVENLATSLRSLSRWSPDLNLDDRDLMREQLYISW